MSLKLGRFVLHEIRDALFAQDGGVMFGPVPRREWGGRYVPDADNRIRLMSRCLLIEAGDRRILVDVGIGDRLPEECRKACCVDRTAFDLDRELARAGTNRAGITDVILTHLHWEHSGGVSRAAGEGVFELAFPRATFHLQRRALRWAHHPSERDAASFHREDFALLERSGRLHLCEGETELFEGIQVVVSDGHAVGMQLVYVQAEDTEVICAGDLLPTAGHVGIPWQMASDLYPLTGLEEKKMLLAQALESGGILFLPHEPSFAACRLSEEDGKFVPGAPVEF